MKILRTFKKLPAAVVDQKRPGRRSAATQSLCSRVGPRSDSSRKTVVVLGASRGGTSSVAGTLRCLGVFMGERFGGKKDNHEDLDFHGQDIDALKQVINERNQKHLVWGWKYPDSIVYLDMILEDLVNPHLVVVFRNPLVVARSVERQHQQFNLERALLHTTRRYHRIGQFVEQHQLPALLINYEDLINQQQLFVRELVDFLGLPEDADRIARATGFIDKQKGYQKL